MERLSPRAISSHLRTFADYLICEFASSNGNQHQISKCIESLNDLVWKCCIVPVDRLVLCLVRFLARYFSASVKSFHLLMSLNLTTTHTHTHTRTRTHTHTHRFSGPLSGTTQVSQYQKRKINLDFTEARDSECQCHQLGHMQVCTSLQTDNHASTPPLSFLQAGCPSCCPTNNVKALKAESDYHWRLIIT